MSKVQVLSLLLILASFVPICTIAQTSDLGAVSSIAITKDFGRNSSVKLEQELRFNQNVSNFNRAKTTLGIDYELFRNLLVAELDYNFIYLNDDKSYNECRHRASVGLSTERSINRVDIGFRTKVQSTWRDESRGNYNYNPKYVWRNKLELDYDVFGIPIKPYISGELFCPLNGKAGFYLDGYRATFGLKYKLTKRHSVEFALLYDQEVQQVNPAGIIYVVAGWKYKL